MPLPPLTILALADPGGLINVVMNVVIAQAVVGAFVLVGAYAIARRFLGSEFPSFRTEVKEQFTALSGKVERLDEKVQALQVIEQGRKVMDHEWERRLARVEGILEQRMQQTSRGSRNLDETRGA